MLVLVFSRVSVWCHHSQLARIENRFLGVHVRNVSYTGIGFATCVFVVYMFGVFQASNEVFVTIPSDLTRAHTHTNFGRRIRW